MNVVLISRDHRLGAILTVALSVPEELTVLESPAEVPERLEEEIDAVVLDLPADSRRGAYDELRQRYEGRVLVPVDNAKDTSGWPPDAKRRFLVRPFHVADLIAGVQEPQEASVAERAAQHRRRFRLTRNQAPAFPSLTAAPSAADGPTPGEPPATTPEAPSSLGEPPAGAPEETVGADATGTTADADATVEFVMEEDDEAEAAEEEHAQAVAEDRAQVTAEAGGEAEPPAEADAEAAAEDEAEEDAEADASEDDAEEAGWADTEPQPRSVEDLRLLPPPEHPEEAPAPEPQPALPVQAGIAMAEAVALKQRLESEEVRRSHSRRRRIVLNVAAGLVLLLVGVGIGRAVAPEQPQKVNPSAVQQPVVQFRNAPPPTACTAAMDNADQVISYLVAKIRDERLSKSIQAYGANARACRTAGR